MKKMILIAALLAVSLVSKAQLVGTGITKSFHRLSFNLFNEILKTEEGNVCFSPQSVQFALSMLLSGAGGNTMEQMRKVMGIEDYVSNEEIHLFNLSRINALTRRPPFLKDEWTWCSDDEEVMREHYEASYPLCEIANALWTRPDISVKEPFTRTLRYDYLAGMGPVRFDTQKGIDEVNAWVDEHTHGLIPQIFSQPQSSDLALVLANSIYLKAAWAVPFIKELTKKEPFYLEDGSEVQVDMMNVSSRQFYVSETGKFKCVTIPYANHFYMTVLVPAEGTELPGITCDDWHLALEAFNNDEVKLSEKGINLKMPKFEIEGNYDLRTPLKNLGMTDAFSPSLCDFYAISDRNLPVSAIYQLDKITVDEEGTEAAAVTVIEANEAIDKFDTDDFFVDRPFYFTIENMLTRSVLFLGKVVNPNGDDAGQTTHIYNIAENDDDNKTEDDRPDQIFDLNGRKLQHVPTHGLYIRNGKIFLNK